MILQINTRPALVIRFLFSLMDYYFLSQTMHINFNLENYIISYNDSPVTDHDIQVEILNQFGKSAVECVACSCGKPCGGGGPHTQKRGLGLGRAWYAKSRA
jgi:hypothetical protein